MKNLLIYKKAHYGGKIMSKSPKHYQKNKNYDSALRIFIYRYIEALENRDFYLSQLYMDEIIQTVLEKAILEDKKLSSNKLISTIEKLISRENFNYSDYKNSINQDLTISLLKRFPRSQIDGERMSL